MEDEVDDQDRPRPPKRAHYADDTAHVMENEVDDQATPGHAEHPRDADNAAPSSDIPTSRLGAGIERICRI